MKKEAINTFQQGLNYDLNPITTPNNVLTDCVNGTFVTFNGDELALQNDAGNTRIVSQIRDNDGDPAEMWEGIYTYSIGSIVWMPEDPYTYYIKTTDEDTIPTTLVGWDKYIQKYIKLSDGFFPIGMKEYGGILYIVSGRNYYEIDAIATDWIPNFPYKKDDVVRYQGYYFKSLIDNNLTSLADPIFSEDEQYIMLHKDSAIMSFESAWDWLDESELGEKKQKIEFGCYPSPENQAMTEYTSEVLSGDILYKPKVINNKIFQTGDYITFTGPGTFDTTYVSGYDNDFNYVQKFYKVKLYHQLNNGLLDITDKVWEQYHIFIDKSFEGQLSGKFWFNDPDFKFKCPTQYKGKLAISLEIEDRINLSLKNVPTLEATGSGHTYTLEVEVNNYGYLSIDSLYTKIYLDDEVKLTKTTAVKFGMSLISFDLGPEFSHKTIRYEIIPNILVDNQTDGASDDLYRTEDSKYDTSYTEHPYSDLPSEFTNKLIINGQRLISSSLDSVIFAYDNGTCDYITHKFTYGKIAIKNSAGEYIDQLLNRSINKYVFLLGEQSLEEGETLIARYTIDAATGKPIVSTWPLVDTNENLKGAFTNLILSAENDSCTELQVVINTNAEYGALNVSQNDISLTAIDSTSTSKTYLVIPNMNFTVFATKNGFEYISTQCNVSQESVLDFAFIADIQASFEINYNNKPSYDWRITWDSGDELVGAELQASPYIIPYVDAIHQYDDPMYANTTRYPATSPAMLAVTILYNNLTTTYQNIPSSEIYNYVYTTYNYTTTIFRKQYSFYE